MANWGAPQQQQHQQLHEPLLFDVDNEIVKERNQEFLALADDLSGLRECMEDMNELVGEQGEDLEKIQVLTENSSAHSKDGARELGSAEHYANARRKKLCCLMILVIIILAALVALIVGLTAGRGGGTSCVPIDCTGAHAECGEISDGCSEIIACGVCTDTGTICQQNICVEDNSST